MKTAAFYWIGLFLTTTGAIVSLLFWLPQVINRQRLKEILGDRYPVVFVIYVANGPLLLLLGLLLLFRFS
jgi:hypothetical protein